MSSRDSLLLVVDFLRPLRLIRSYSFVLSGGGVRTTDDGFHPFSYEMIGCASDGGLDPFAFRVEEDDLADSRVLQ